MRKKLVDVIKNVIDRRFHVDKLFVADLAPYQIIFTDDLMSVRVYLPEKSSADKKKFSVPVILVPPLGVSAWIFDLLPERSLVKHLLDQGFHVYLIDWGEPGRQHAHLSLENYVVDWFSKAVTAVRLHAKKTEVSLVGYCMGGLLALLYTAYFKDTAIRNIAVLGSPIDFHVTTAIGRVMSKMNRPLNRLSKWARFSLLDMSPDFFHMSGRALSASFNLTSPMSGIKSTLDLLVNLADREYVAMHTTTAKWFNEMQDYPGAMVQSVLIHFGLNNLLAKDSLSFTSGAVRFSAIESAIFAVAGLQDRIVPIEAVRRVLDVVSSTDKRLKIVPGGHAGLFAGAKAPETTWLYLAEWLTPRSD